MIGTGIEVGNPTDNLGNVCPEKKVLSLHANFDAMKLKMMLLAIVADSPMAATAAMAERMMRRLMARLLRMYVENESSRIRAYAVGHCGVSRPPRRTHAVGVRAEGTGQELVARNRV